MTKRLNLERFFYKSESVLFNQSVVIMDPRWKHPFPALVAGPTFLAVVSCEISDKFHVLFPITRGLELNDLLIELKI